MMNFKRLPVAVAIALVAAVGAAPAAAQNTSPAVAASPSPTPKAVATTTPTPAPPAAPPSTPAPVGVVSASDRNVQVYMDRLRQQVAVLELQSKIADLNKHITEANEPPAAAAAAAPATPVAAAPAVPIPAVPEAPVHPLRLLGVLEVGGKAAVTIDDGGTRVSNATVGTVLPSGWRVTAIGPANVRVTRGRTSKNLPLGD